MFAKCARRLIPFMLLLYVTNYIDRVNVGFAVLTMNKDLAFSPAIFGLGAGMFSVGYFLFQIPASMSVRRVGARSASILLHHAVATFTASPQASVEHPKPRLAKMRISRQYVCKFQLPHYDETRTIGERIAVIAVTTEKRLGRLEAQTSNPFHTDPGALIDEIQDLGGDVMTGTFGLGPALEAAIKAAAIMLFSIQLRDGNYKFLDNTFLFNVV